MNSNKFFFFLNIVIVILVVIVGVAFAWTNPTGNPPSGSGSGFVKFLTTPVNKVNWTAATDWTDVDISANTGADTAKAAIVVVDLEAHTLYGNYNLAMSGWLRKNGSSETSILPRIKVNSFNGPYYGDFFGRSANMMIIELDSNEVFETKLQLDAGTFGSATYKVDLIGYILQ